MIVVDASVMVEALIGGDVAVDRLAAGEPLAVPHLLEAEVGSALRSQVMAGGMAADVAKGALDDLAEMWLLRYEHDLLFDRAWELRHNLSFYDGLYVALAEWHDVPLVTVDVRLANAPGVKAAVEVLGEDPADS